jgi:hypothetical protein
MAIAYRPHYLVDNREAYCDMKIKEKGLTGKAADLRKDTISSRKGFNAFREMENPSKSKSNGKSKEKPEILLEFMGERIRVYDDNEDGIGYVKTEDVPFVRGATLKFTGCGGDANFTEMKARVSISSRYNLSLTSFPRLRFVTASHVFHTFSFPKATTLGSSDLKRN